MPGDADTGTGGQIEQLVIPAQHWQAILDYIQRFLPEEACGLAGGSIIGTSARVTEFFPVANVLHSPVRFRMDPSAQLRVFSMIEARGLDLVAIVHSHPSGPEIPSATDVAEFYYPGVLSLIVSPAQPPGLWRARGFIIAAEGVVEVPLVFNTE